MDWEQSVSGCVSDIDFSSDNSHGAHDDDADDEQSDWPDYSCRLTDETVRNNQNEIWHQRQFHTAPQSGSLAPPSTSKSPCLSAGALKRIERFVGDTQQRELILTQVYRTSLVCFLLYMYKRRGSPYGTQLEGYRRPTSNGCSG